ncbi:uncharacterized protein [Procambarus clarkii]|uniref:uncharacterized protein isoform X2 n=1 Tax=Procambarus clarkii TaxID=6728 RepID=UPI001E670E12|nr:serine-rich adhesin for platelets-like isoform X2 [Procambarus clarkii]
MPKGSSCKARGCTSNKTDNPDLSFHSFPKNKERFKIWCDLIKRPDLNHSKVITNRMSMRVCSLHFEDRMYMSPNNKSRLIWCAVPKPVADDQSPPSVSTSSNECVDSKADLASKADPHEKQKDISASHATDSTLLSQPLPLAKGSKKFDWSLALDEDVIIKEESMMDQDNNLELSPPPSPEADSPSSFCTDTKEGIIKHDHTGSKCTRKVNSSARVSHQVTADTGPSSKSELPEPVKGAMASEMATLADDYMHSSDVNSNVCQTSDIPQKPKKEVGKTLPAETLSSTENTEGSALVLSHVKEEPVRYAGASFDDDTESQIETSKSIETLQHAQLCQPSKIIFLASTKTSEQSGSELLSTTNVFSSNTTCLATTNSSESSDSTSATTTNSLQKSTPSASINTTSSSDISRTSRLHVSPSLAPYSQSNTKENSSLDAGESKLIPAKSSIQETLGTPADLENHLKKLSDETSGDEQTIMVAEGDLAVVNDKDLTCEEECTCSKCQEKSEKAPSATTKPPCQVHRTYSGPIKRQTVKTKGGGKRTFMILNKASLKVLQAKGLIQPLKKFAESQPSACETLLPSVQSMQNKSKIQYHSIATSPNGSPLSFEKASMSVKTSGSTAQTPSSMNQLISLSNKAPSSLPQTPVVVTWSATNGTDTPSFTFTIQLPPGSNQPCSTPQTPLQIVTPPVSIGGLDSGSTYSSSQVNKLSSNLNKTSGINQSFEGKSQSLICNLSKSETGTTKTQTNITVMQSSRSSSGSNNCTYTNTVTSESPIMSTQFPLVSRESPSDHINITHSGIDLSGNDLEGSNDYLSSGPSSPQINTEDTAINQKPEIFPIGIASGPCKIRKGGMKMYRYVNMPDGSNKAGPKSSQNVRWVALPAVPIGSGQPLVSDALKTVISSLQNTRQGTAKTHSSADTLSSDLRTALYEGFPIGTVEHKGGASIHQSPYKSANRELKKKYSRLLNKHRQRYHLLLKKYKALENKFAVVEDAGTPEQVIRDARNFLSEEHVLFLESQMFLRNRPGTGNRFSKKFMRLMIEYYKRSAAGYRFLRTIFTIPSVKTVQKWLSKPLNIREDEGKDPLAIPMQMGDHGEVNNGEICMEASGSGLGKAQSACNSENSSLDRRSYSRKLSQGRSTPDESDMEEGSSEEYDSEESGLEEIEDEEEVMQESENARKRLPGQSSQGSNERDITIDWEEEPWPL